MDPLLGQTLLGRYRIEAFVGRGGMSDVYKAWDVQRNAHVAIKLLREDLAQDLVFRRKFRREATVLQTLNHPNIVRFYSFEEQDLLAFLVLEYIEGSALRALIASGGGEPFTTGEALAYLAPICSALQYGHSEGVFHCDVKPGNVLIEDRSGRVLVSDFGIAKLAESATTTVSTPGTPAYMSPEQCRGKGLDQRTDIYSLGITLYEMLTGGERPFVGEKAPVEGTTGEKIRWEHINQDPVPPSAHNPGLAPAVENVVLKALAKYSDDRYQSVLGLLEAYQEVTGETVTLPPVHRVTAAPPPSVPPSEGARPAFLGGLGVAGIVAVLAIICIGGVLILPSVLAPNPAPAPTEILVPAAEHTRTATATRTSVPPTPTSTDTAIPTDTRVPPTPTRTFTPVPPTATRVPPTATRPRPTPTATRRPATPTPSCPPGNGCIDVYNSHAAYITFSPSADGQGWEERVDPKSMKTVALPPGTYGYTVSTPYVVDDIAYETSYHGIITVEAGKTYELHFSVRCDAYDGGGCIEPTILLD